MKLFITTCINAHVSRASDSHYACVSAGDVTFAHVIAVTVSDVMFQGYVQTTTAGVLQSSQ